MNRMKDRRNLPWLNWAGTIVSLTMTLLYIQRLVGPGEEPHTGLVTAAWVLMFVAWLASAIYKTWYGH